MVMTAPGDQSRNLQVERLLKAMILDCNSHRLWRSVFQSFDRDIASDHHAKANIAGQKCLSLGRQIGFAEAGIERLSPKAA